MGPTAERLSVGIKSDLRRIISAVSWLIAVYGNVGYATLLKAKSRGYSRFISVADQSENRCKSSVVAVLGVC